MEDDSRRTRLRALAWLAIRHPLRSAADLVSRRRWKRDEDVRPLRRLAPAARRLAHFGADHLHAHFAAGAALDAMRLGSLLSVPYSVMTHGYDLFERPANLREKHERAAFAATACDYSATYVEDLTGVRPHTIVVGVDPERFRRSTPHPEGRTVLA